jgi:dihydrofolate reductase
MRKLFWQISATLDGYMEGPDHDLKDTAEVADPDFDRYASEMLQSIDAFVVGRRTYQLFVGYWPTATGPDADRLNSLPKIVFSRTLESVEWNNARLAGEDGFEEIRRLKHEPGGDIALFGSADLAASLARHGLIDEVRVFVSPVVLGSGTPMFGESWDRKSLKLRRAETWSTGIVALFYEVLTEAK